MFNFKFKANTSQWKNVSEGYHTAMIVAATTPTQMEGQNGPYTAFRYVFEVVDEFVNDKKDKNLTIRSKPMRVDSIHPKSNLYKLASAALKAKDFTLVRPSDLYGKFVDIVVVHNQSEDGTKTYANVENVLPCKTIPTNFKSTYEPSDDIMDDKVDDKAEKELTKLEADAKKSAASSKEDAELEKEFGHLFTENVSR